MNNRVLKNLKSTTCSQSLNELALLSSGLSELNQYKNAINITEIALNDTNKNFDKIKSGLTYIVSLLHSEGSNCFSFLVQERRKLNLRTTNGRLGGSGFHALAKGNNTVAYCPYVDHFNDSYSIYCPLIETCVAVSIHVIYFDYLAYTRKVIAHFPLNKLIFSGVICDAATHQQQFFPYPSLHWKKKSVLQEGKFAWKLQRKYEDLMSQDEIRVCLQRSNETIYFIGDSHARYVVNHLLRMNGLPTVVKRNPEYHAKNIHYYERTFTDHVLKTFKSTLIALKSKSVQATIVLSVGSWDVHVHSLHHFATYAVKLLLSEIPKLERDGYFQLFNVIIFDIPPMPLNYRRHTNMHKQNLMAIAAANRLLADVFNDVNVTFVQNFALLRLFVNESAPNDSHYLFANDTAEYGNIGISIGNYLLQLICEHSYRLK